MKTTTQIKKLFSLIDEEIESWKNVLYTFNRLNKEKELVKFEVWSVSIGYSLNFYSPTLLVSLDYKKSFLDLSDDEIDLIYDKVIVLEEEFLNQ